jgi:hypothetical protein
LTRSASSLGQSADGAAAESLFNEGRILLETGKVVEACDRFRRSQQIEPAVGTLLNLSDCYERQDKLASAWQSLRQAVAFAAAHDDVKRADLARTAADRMASRLGRVTIHIAEQAPGLTVHLGDTILDAATWGTSVPFDAGHYAIEADAPGRQSWTQSVLVVDGAAVVVTVPALAGVSAPATETAPREASTSGSSAQRTVGVLVAGGGGALLVAGLVFGGLAIGKWASITSTCPNGVCATPGDVTRLAPDEQTASTYATVGTVGVIAGAAALGIGLVIALTAHEPLVVRPSERGASATFALPWF